ncbi:LPXTG cell wall anchor domain-containing protein [Streptomyces sp. NPDC048507]|uniref:LPXTG cell wall anchor domain-containing protein n=1 Tax=Streptomyces sp. NPDC048507 TaxID=3365560 RepID=UPI0037139FEB
MRQRISLLAACGLVVAGLATATAPAQAADPVLTPAAPAADPVLTLAAPAALALVPHPADGAPKPVALAVRLEQPAGASAFTGPVTFTVDLAKAAGVATVREVPAAGAAPRCAAVASTLVCKDEAARAGSPRGIDLEVAAAKGAADGASGAIAVSGAGAGVTVKPAVTAVTVGGPDLVMEEMRLKRDPKPGESQPLPLAFANRGGQPARGVVLELEASHGLEFGEHYDNCAYRITATSTTALCTVEGEFKAGESYELAGDSPLHLKATAHARAELLGYGIYPAAPAAPAGANAGAGAKPGDQAAGDQAAGDQAGKNPAGGRKLTAKKRAATLTPALRGPDLNPADNRREAGFAVTNTADLAADPLVVKGKAGATAKAVVSVRNQGPAWVFEPRSEAPAAVVDVALPPGLKVLTAPAACRSTGADTAPRYLCATGTSLSESAKAEFPFEVRIDKAVPDARGAITVGRPGPGGEPQRHPFDPVLANNQAAFTVNPTGPAPSTSGTPSPSGSPSPSASASASASPSAGASGGATAAGGSGSRGPLASTGSTAGPLGLAGAGLVLVGGGLYVAFRRRRTA